MDHWVWAQWAAGAGACYVHAQLSLLDDASSFRCAGRVVSECQTTSSIHLTTIQPCCMLTASTLGTRSPPQAYIHPQIHTTPAYIYSPHQSLPPEPDLSHQPSLIDQSISSARRIFHLRPTGTSRNLQDGDLYWKMLREAARTFNRLWVNAGNPATPPILPK